MRDTDRTVGRLSAKLWEAPWSLVTGGASIRSNETEISLHLIVLFLELADDRGGADTSLSSLRMFPSPALLEAASKPE